MNAMLLRLLVSPLFWKIIGGSILVAGITYAANEYADYKAQKARMQMEGKLQELSGQVAVKEASIIELREQIEVMDARITEKVKIIRELEKRRPIKEKVVARVEKETKKDEDLVKKTSSILSIVGVDSSKFIYTK